MLWNTSDDFCDFVIMYVCGIYMFRIVNTPQDAPRLLTMLDDVGKIDQLSGTQPITEIDCNNVLKKLAKNEY